MTENDCDICYETKCVFKRLQSCSHAFCELCCKKLIKNDKNVLSIKCPLCLTSTILDDNTLHSLQTKIKPLKGILCCSCCKSTQLDDHWWCIDCKEAVCSSCFMKKHNKHESRNCDDGLLLHECATALKPFATVDQEKEKLIHKFCEELRDRLSFAVNVRNFLIAAELLIGENNKEIVAEPIENDLASKIVFASKILNACRSDDSSKNVDVHVLEKISESNKINEKYDWSKLTLVADMFSGTHTVQPEMKDRSKVIRWSSMMDLKLKTPSSMCITPSCGTIVLVDSQGMYKIDSTLKNVIFKDWSTHPASSGKFLFDSTILYHPQRKSCFVTREVESKKQNPGLFEHDVDTLKLKYYIHFPHLSTLGEAHLINILPDGRIVCARSNSHSRCLIWIMLNFSFPINWKTVWDSHSSVSDKDTFHEMSVNAKLENDMSNVIVLGEHYTYLFCIKGIACTLVTKLVNPNYEWGPSIRLNDRLYYLDQNRNYLFPYTSFTPNSLIKVNDKQNDNQIILHASDKVIMTANGNKVCLLNCVKQKLYVGFISDSC